MPGQGGGSNVIQQQQNDPPAWLAPHLKNIAGQAGALYQKGVGPSYYPGATYAPINLQGQAGLQQTQGLAQRGNPLMGGLLSAANRAITQGGLSGEQRDALDPLYSIQRTQFGRGNTDFGNMLDLAANKTRDMMQSSFGGMGRDDPGGAAMGQIGEAIGDLYTKGYAQQYNADRDAALAASGQIHGVLGQGQQNAYNWAGMAPQLRDMQFDDARRLMQVGQAYQQDLQNQINANRQRWDFNQMRPWNQLNLYKNTAAGLGGGSGTTTTTGPQQNPLWGILGGGLSGLGLLGSLLGGG